MAIEVPAYRVLEQDGAYELRAYPPEIFAETEVRSDFDAAGGAAFRRLLGYISGRNRPREKIAMTAPVTQVGGGESYRVAFLMPAGYTAASLPVPLDSSISIREIPARTLAAWRYSGRWTRSRYEDMERALREVLNAKHLRATGPPIFARYDAPFVPWPLRRNEVLIPVSGNPP
jgi:hypothetical protein